MKKFLILFVAIAAIAQIACNDDDDNTSPYPPNVVVIDDDITTNTVWSGDSVYLIKAWDFYVEATLTIEPGCVVKFHPADGPDLTLGSGGTIVANGTVDDPIIFTSFKDDAFGGDVNGDESATMPAAADWGGINLNSENGSTFNYCQFYYGGGSTYLSTLQLYDASNVTVTNCVFAHNKGGKVGDFYYGALDATESTDGTVIEDNVFFDNYIPLSISTEYSLGNTNIFHNPDDATETNELNGIFVYAIDEFSKTITWAEDEVAYVINDNDLWIENGTALTLSDNVVVKFTSGSAWVLDAGGTINEGNNVIYTSFKDDVHGGDTNGDGAATTPANNDWIGIFDNSLTIPSPYYFQWSNIYYDSY